MADETHHRDVNHTFADMKADDPNPYVLQHQDNAVRAWRMSADDYYADTTNIKIKE